MENYERGMELTLDDNSKFVVVDSFVINDKQYLYLINEDDKRTTMIVEVNNDEIIEIDDEKELEEAYKELIIRNKDEISEHLKEFNEN